MAAKTASTTDWQVVIPLTIYIFILGIIGYSMA